MLISKICNHLLSLAIVKVVKSMEVHIKAIDQILACNGILLLSL